MLNTILRAIEFYWKCATWAARGTLELANAWFWLLGVPIVGGINYKFWGGKMTIPDHIPEFLIFMCETVAISWALFFLVRFVGAPPYFQLEARRQIEELNQALIHHEERAKPKINVFLDKASHGVAEGPTEVGVAVSLAGKQSIRGPSSKWVQVSITSASEAPLIDCEVWLTSLRLMGEKSLGPELVEEHINCSWSQSDQKKIIIPPKRIQRINLFSLYADGQPIRPWTSPVKIRLRDAIQIPGSYRLEMMVTAQNAPTEERSYNFTWRDFSDVTLDPI